MGKHLVKKPEASTARGPCVTCGDNPQARRGRNRMGQDVFRAQCANCHMKRHGTHARGYSVHKGDTCERCGFVPEHSCQLDVDHVDGDHSNDAPENLQTLCANCHRLKTIMEKDHLPRGVGGPLVVPAAAQPPATGPSLRGRRRG